MLMIFYKNLVKLNIVWLSEKNIGLKPWDGGSICSQREVSCTSIMHMILVYDTTSIMYSIYNKAVS